MSLQKRQVKWSWALFSVGPPMRYAHSWRNAPSLYPAANSLARASKYSYSFVCMRGKRGHRLRPNPLTQLCKFALCSCREGNVHHRSAQSGPFCIGRAGSSTTRSAQLIETDFTMAAAGFSQLLHRRPWRACSMPAVLFP
jgi:hypothetical protein